MITVKPHAERHADRAGDPLDGLVNMFDLGIVLALAFLLAALQSADLTEVLTNRANVEIVRKQRAQEKTIVVKPDEQLRSARPSSQRAAGRGVELGKVYRLSDGRLVYVTGKPK